MLFAEVLCRLLSPFVVKNPFENLSINRIRNLTEKGLGPNAKMPRLYHNSRDVKEPIYGLHRKFNYSPFISVDRTSFQLRVRDFM